MWGHHAKRASPSEARRSSASDPSLHVPRSPFQTPLVKKEVQPPSCVLCCNRRHVFCCNRRYILWLNNIIEPQESRFLRLNNIIEPQESRFLWLNNSIEPQELWHKTQDFIWFYIIDPVRVLGPELRTGDLKGWTSSEIALRIHLNTSRGPKINSKYHK